jgi:hypothetical protein
MSKNSFSVYINAGKVNRLNEIVSFPLKPNSVFDNWQEGISSLAMSKINDGGEAIDHIPCQFEPGTRKIYWMTGDMKKGESVRYQIRCDNIDAELPERYQIEKKPAHLLIGDNIDAELPERYQIEKKPAHLLIDVDGRTFIRYNYLGVWKPYFWPVNGTFGTVVRGAGGGDHPHHTGLYLAYGGHGEGGSANIWSDWDEPPYGPCGKMLHQRFVNLSGGHVYAAFVEELTYVKGNGDIILEEKRTARAWYADGSARFLDLSFETSPILDIGERQFLFVARIAPSMNIPDEGHVENSEGDVGRREIHHKRARWCDFSGKVVDGINGISIFDHPGNQEYPGLWGEIAVPSQITLLHHPPDELAGDRFCLNFRVYIHDGEMADADVENRYQSYVSPVNVGICDD